ncbi:MAG TPA: glycosyltransferase [Thermomicrobiales bacterium]|nr:glycosyltransferase [Thermomicrobiales bacterium]
MRVLFTTQVGAGHWRPLAPFAQALAAAGHEVAFASTPVACEDIARHGLRCFPVGDDEWWRQSQRPPPAETEQADAVAVNYFVPLAERRLPALLTLGRDWRPDLIVREQTEFAGCLAAEALGLPHATVQVSAFRGAALDQVVAAPLNRLRADLGLPPDPALAMLYRYLLVLPFPPRYQEPAIPLPPTAHFVRHIAFDLDHPGETLPAWIANLPHPIVYATLGTAYNRTPGVFPAILASLRDEPVHLIATVNHNQNPADFGDQPAHIQLARYLPQSLVFLQCDLVVTHGGSGTVRTALSAGLPLVILPIAADQPDNARRCAALGVARVVAPRQRTPAAIRAAVHDVLSNPTYRQRAEQLRDEMQALPGPDYVTALLERLALARRPLVQGESAATS